MSETTRGATTATPLPHDAVVVGVDGGAAAMLALVAAAQVAQRQRHPLHILNVAPSGLIPVSDEGLRRHEELAERCRERAALAVPGIDISSSVEIDDPAAALVRASHQASLVAVGAGGYGRTASMLLGATAHKLAAHAACPVLVTPRSGHWSAAGPVIVGVDASEHSVPAVAYAFGEAASRGAELVPVHTWWSKEPMPFLSWSESERDDVWMDALEATKMEVSEMLAGWSEKYPDVVVRPTMVRGRADTVLSELSSDAQLLVVGSRGRGGFGGLLLGSVSQSVLHHAWCPVVIAPSPRRPLLS